MDSLLKPLLEDPGDPSVLRVLSDALLERADPWGEAIRLALDLERTFRGEDAHRLGYRRLQRLQARHGSSWRRRVRDALPQPVRAPVGLFRGIPSKVNSSDSQVATLLEGPVAWLDFTGSAATSLVPTFPRRAGLVRIELSQYGDPAEGRKLLGPGLSSLTSLSMPWNGDPTLELLAAATWTKQLERLRLFGNETSVSPAQLDRLMKLPLPKLRALELEGLALGQPGAERLTAMPWKLERLTLAGANLGVKGTVALAGAPVLCTVRELNLSRNTMGPTGAAALATSPHLSGVVFLDLCSTASGGKSLAPFFEALALPRLKALAIASCGLKGKAIEPLALARSKVFSQLTELDLAHNLMGDDGLATLSKSTALTGVRVLNLVGNAIKGSGIAALGHSALLGLVEVLSLEQNKFQNAGAKGLAASKRVGALRVLSLGHNWLGVQGLKAMLGNPALCGLEEVREGMNNYGAELGRSFVASKTLKLWTLGLGPETTTDALAELLASPRLATLDLLSLSCRAFDDRLAGVLMKSALAKSATTLRVSRVWCRELTEAGAQALASVLGPRVSFD